MSALIETIKSQALQARKARDTLRASLLVTLDSDVAMRAKNDGNREATDADAMKVIKSFLDGIKDTLAARPEDEKALAERGVLLALLPEQMSEQALRESIATIAKEKGIDAIDGKAVGSIMGELRSRHPGLFDSALAGKLIREHKA